MMSPRPQVLSSAVRIVNPSERQDDTEKPTQKKVDLVQRQCRNIMIYGSCKFQDHGCVYYHPPTSQDVVQRVDVPATTAGLLTPQAVNAPVFVPKGPSIIPTSSSPPPPPLSVSISQNLTSPSATPAPDYTSPEGYDQYYSDEMEDLNRQMQGLDTSYYPSTDQGHYQSEYDDPYYQAPQPTFVRQPLNYHLYTAPIHAAFVSSAVDTHFVPATSTLRQELQTRSEIIHTGPSHPTNLPEELQGYHSLALLETIGTFSERRKFGNWYSTVYRAVSVSDGLPYVLRRIEGYRITNQAALSPVEQWARIIHPNLIAIKEGFTTHAFGDVSLVVVYAYHPSAQTLFDLHIRPKPPQYETSRNGRSTVLINPAASMIIPERTLWSYIIQIAGAIRKVHEAGHAVRMVDVTKVLVTDRNRVRISSCGIVDVLMYDSTQDFEALQQEDLTMFGRLVFTLGCNGSGVNVNNAGTPGAGSMQKAVEVLNARYTSDINSVAMFFIGKNNHKNIGQLFELIAPRMPQELEDAHIGLDRLETEMMSELENARLFRLVCKFGFINERPEFARDARWSETGDRYIIKLFRDYVFHQIDEGNNPVVNLAHVLTCLNKLDAGTDERIMLTARDDQSCLVVSYKEVKECLDAAFSELARGGGSAVR